MHGAVGRHVASSAAGARPVPFGASHARPHTPHEDALIIGQEGTTQRAEGGAAAPGFEVREANLTAFDKTTGDVVGQVALPRKATAAPITPREPRSYIEGETIREKLNRETQCGVADAIRIT